MPTTAKTSLSAAEQARHAFKEEFKKDCEFVAAAPGRVNLIGEHTDYNQGFVLPMAIDREVVVAARRRRDGKLRLYSSSYRDAVELDLGDLKYRLQGGWDNYVAAMHWALQGAGFPVQGADMLVQGNLPQGAGLSSSAALELAVARAASALGGWAWDPKATALLAQKAENEFVGVDCGIMDQFAVAVSKPRSALFLDCSNLETRSIPLELNGAEFLVVNSMVTRQLLTSQYNQRRSECAEANLRLGVSSLRSLRPEALAGPGHEGQVWWRRARHVVSENARVESAVAALESGDLARFGALMNASHDSLRDDYEVSCRELDVLVDTARSCRGVYGARMTGAGFGGCTVNLVASDQVGEIRGKIEARYLEATGKSAQFFSFLPGHPARIL